MGFKKIAIIGISASGKSTFSRELHKVTDLPLFHMDKLFWRGKWEEVPEVEYLIEEQKLLQKDKWIIEGYVDQKHTDRLKQADLIIYLDYSGLRCALYYIKRIIKHSRRARPEMSEEALDAFEANYFWRIFMRRERPGIETALRDVDKSKVVRLSSPRELRKFMNNKFKA